MNPAAVLLVAALSFGQEPPGREMTVGEARIFESYSRCASTLMVCRSDLTSANTDKSELERDLQALQDKPPPPPETEVPILFWIGSGGAVVAAVLAGFFIGKELSR